MEAWEQRAFAEAEKLGVPFVCVDDRPLPESASARRNALGVQGQAFAEVLHQHGAMPLRVSRIGEVTLETPAGERTYTVAQMRSLLREKQSAKTMAAFLSLGLVKAP